MAGFCLPKFVAEELKTKFKNGEISPEKLSEMTSAERRKAFEFLGEENAKQTNALFESKLLLKNQQLGMVNWAKQILKLKPEILRDTLSKVEKMSEVMTPKELDMFLEDLVDKKLGIDVSVQEAGKLVDLAREVESSKTKVDHNSPPKSESRLEYGFSLVMFKKYVEGLKVKGESLPFKDYLKVKNWGKGVYDLAATSKSLLSTLDNSFFGRQGIKTLYTNPDIWWDGFKKSWGDIGKELKGVDAVDAIKADIYSRENALNGKYKAGEYAIGLMSEEAFPSPVLNRIPLLGRVPAAAEAAYNGAALRFRADLADRVIRNAESAGVDVTDPFQAKSLGKLVNSMTGRGSIGRLETIGKEINASLFSIKFLKSNFDTLTAHTLDTKMSGYAKSIARKNLIKIVASTGAILVLADTLQPGSVEWNPESADFGKIRIGNTRFDITGGMAGIVTLAARLATSKSKSSITGKTTDLGSNKFGALNRMDVLQDYAAGKTSPALKAVIDWFKGRDFSGKKPTIGSTAKNLVTPLPITTFQELKDNPDSADVLWSFIASELGIGVNTYSKR